MKHRLFYISLISACLLTAFSIGAQQSGTKIWEFQSEGRINSTPALGSDGTIYFGGGNWLYALNPDSSLKWRFKTQGAIFSSPVVSADGVFATSLDGRLYALSTNGRQKWSYNAGSAIYSSPALEMDGDLYFGADDGSVTAVNSNGKKIWSFSTLGPVRSSPALAADRTLYIASWDNHIYALSPTGTEIWSFKTGHYLFSSPAIGTDGTIYVGSVDKKLYALTSQGSNLWSYATTGHLYSSPAIGSDGSIYVGSWDNKLYAISAAGKIKWTFSTGNLVQSSPAIGSDGTIYFGADEKKVYALNSDGSLRWFLITSGIVRSSPVISPEGILYIGAEDGRMYAIRGSSGPAESPWPMFRGNARHWGKVSLVITQPPQSQRIIIGQQVNFNIQVSGPGPLSYQWKLDGTNVPIATNSSLVISNVQPIHGGEYTVVVSNLLETVTSMPAQLTVVVPPVITLQPQSATVKAGSQLNLQVTARSVVPLTYQWYFQTNPIPQAISANLDVPEIKPEQSGLYHVKVKNSAGTTTSDTASISVITPPFIIQAPRSQVGAVGTQVEFSVAATSKVAISYQWLFNNTNIPGANSTNLIINNIQPANAGNYAVNVNNLAGSVISPQANLTVTLPPLITLQPKDQSSVTGGVASFVVVATSAGPLTYQWYFNKTNLLSTMESTLSLRDLTTSMEGIYSVVVSNVAGCVTSSPATLTVYKPPFITVQPRDQAGVLGKDAVFKIGVTGSPPLTIFWKQSGSIIPGATNSALYLNKLAASQAGLYQAVVTNFAGSVTSRAAVLTIPQKKSLWDTIVSWF